MTNIPMPEPVAFLVDWPDEPDLGHYFADEQAAIGRSQPLITTTQAEAYAAARVKEALETVESVLTGMHTEAMKSRMPEDEAEEGWNEICLERALTTLQAIERVRALIAK